MALSPSRWRLVDRVLAGYGVFVALVALSRWPQRGSGWILLAHLGLPLLAWLSTRATNSSSGRFLRAAYPALLLTGLYSAIDVLNGFGTAPVHDAVLQQVEAGLFHGSQPSRDWWRSAPSAFWSTLFHGVYFSYYLIIPLPLLIFIAQARTSAIEQYLDGLITTFVLCYACYILFPVAGPYYAYARPTGEFVANGAARGVYRMLSVGSAFGAAFPSSHVAATVAATVGAWLGMRRLGQILAVPTVLLAVGVVYCQMHYVVDSAAGLVLGLAVPLWLARHKQIGASHE